MEIFHLNNKSGLRNQEGEILIPCEYDEIQYDERSNCYLCYRDGDFDEHIWGMRIYTGVKDLYSIEGKFMIGGFDSCNYFPVNDVFMIHFGRFWEDNGRHKQKNDKYGRWLMLNRDMSTTIGRVSFAWQKINCFRIPLPDEMKRLKHKNENDICHIVDLPESLSFVDYHILSDNQVVLLKDHFVDTFWYTTPYDLVFIKERTEIKSCDWYLPIGENICIYESKENHNLGIATNLHTISADYKYISKPKNGWCLCVAYMQCKPYDPEIDKLGYCALINIHNKNQDPIILFKGIHFRAIEDLIKNNVLQIVNIDEAKENSKDFSNLYVPKELYNLGILNSSKQGNIICGPSIHNIKNSTEFVSCETLNENKRKYYKMAYPQRYETHNDYISPLEAFEGDEELYNEWLLNS